MLLAAPVSADAAGANSAEFVVSENGKLLNVTAHLVQQSTFTLVKPGFFQDEALTPKNFSLTDANGTAVEYKVSKSTVSFPKGDYTLSYTQEISDSTVYAKFPVAYSAKVYLPAKFRTGHPVLGTVSAGGVISGSDKEGFGTMVTYANTKTVDVKFYEQGRDMWLYGFLGVWGVVLLIVYGRYRMYRKRSLKAGLRDKYK
ncbi:MAG TPA: DUF5803 family protein [Methanocorpusculum sp.]|nr:DUF5803 family protein [Methanocorpusculum sp.]